MKVFLTDQRQRLNQLIPVYKALPLSYDSTAGMRERETSAPVAQLGPDADLSAYDLDFLFNYDIYPRSIMNFAAEWAVEQRKMDVGDVIVQQALMPPFGFGMKMVCAVRVLEIVRTPQKVGFTYGTVQGHPERGEAAFHFLLRDGEVWASTETRSMPGMFISRLVAPVVSRPYQQYCANRGLSRMRSLFLKSTQNKNLQAKRAA